MKTAADFFAELKRLKEEVNERNKRLRALQSQIDSQVNKVVHEIERDSYDAVGGFEKINSMKKLLQQRRVIKGEQLRMKDINHHLCSMFPSVEEEYLNRVQKDEQVRAEQNTTISFSEVFEELTAETEPEELSLCPVSLAR